MKLLNEKHLAYFATCDSRVDKEGWLHKKGDANKSFHKRWFSLKGNLLFYFEKKGDREPNGVIILEGYTVELCENNQFAFMINYRGLGCRSYVLSAESQEVMESWMTAITCAGYDYMKLMLADLQCRLNSLNSLDNLADRSAGCMPQPPTLLLDDARDGQQPGYCARTSPEDRVNDATKLAARQNPFNSHVKSSNLDVEPMASQRELVGHGSPAPPTRRRDRNTAFVTSESSKKDLKNGRSRKDTKTAAVFQVIAPPSGSKHNNNGSALPMRDFLQLQTLYGKQIDLFLLSGGAL